MCGITGIYIVNNPSEVSEKTLVKMRDTLIHRGPDDEGLYISNDKKLGLGFRRLAIIDLSKDGNQPMFNENKKISLVFNGEIYNFHEIREELIRKGHQFRSKTDSETIVHLYEEKQEKCLDDLNGMFAFVIWDEKRQKLFAARDRIGIKPLYYYYQDGIFIFGSEIKAILEHPFVKREPDLEGISHYLSFACTPAPSTLFKDIKKLPAGHYLTLDKFGHLETHRYWSPFNFETFKLFNKAQSSAQAQEEFFVAQVRKLLKESIELQMVSDVPFGCFLSGGIDSSTNAVLMSQAMNSPVETFSISFKGFPSYDEFEYSRKIAEILGSKRHEILVGEEEFLDWLEKLAYYADDPNGDWVCFPVFYLSKLFRDSGVIMGQVGEGSDELFSGYDRDLSYYNFWKKYWRYLEKLPQFFKAIPYHLSKILPKYQLTFHKELCRRLAFNKPFFFGGATVFTAYDKQFLLTDSFKKQVPCDISDKIVEGIYSSMSDSAIARSEATKQSQRLPRFARNDNKFDFLQRYLYLELNLRLPELLLMRVDKMAMANSIETRVPFLDHRLVELAFFLPMQLKLKNNTTKYILKEAVKGVIPNEIIYRKKKGFGAPVAEWLKQSPAVQKELIDIIQKSRLKELDVFNYNYIDDLIDYHLKNRHNNAFKLWNLVTLSLWYDHWIR